MSLFESIILGLLQGLTEFLPISSSGHLVILESILDIDAGDLVFEVSVHFGTFIAVVLYFRKRLADMLFSVAGSLFAKSRAREDETNRKLAWYLIIGTIPAAIVGILANDYIEAAFASPRWASAMLLVTAALLFSTRWAKDKAKDIDPRRTILIGLAQAVAIMPGISRSGSTISIGMFTGMKKGEAAEFSFLLALPAILGATILQLPDFVKNLSDFNLITNYAIGTLVATITGYISISLLLSIIKKGKFFYFGLYCAIVGLIGVLFL